MEHQLHVERRRTATASSAAVATMVRFVGNPKLYEAFNEGFNVHGSGFAAFLLAPETRYIAPEDLLRTYSKAFRVKGYDRDEAIEELIKYVGWAEMLRTVYERVEMDGAHLWADRELREVLDDGYVFAQTYDDCYVFDRTTLRNHSMS